MLVSYATLPRSPETGRESLLRITLDPAPGVLNRHLSRLRHVAFIGALHDTDAKYATERE
jgi:hypothetical protein